MANDIWTPGTNWNTGSDFTEAKAEQEITDNINVLSLIANGDASANAAGLRLRHLRTTYAALPAASAATLGRIAEVSDFDCYFKVVAGLSGGHHWEPLPGMRGKGCEVFEDDFYGMLAWPEVNTNLSTQGHTTTGESAIYHDTGATINSVSGRYTSPKWAVLSNRAPAWFEVRVRDFSAIRQQQDMTIGFTDGVPGGSAFTHGIYFRKASAGSEALWNFQVLNGSTLQSPSSGAAAISASTGASWLVFRFVAESATVVKGYFNDTLIATYSTPTATFSTGAARLYLAVSNQEAAGKRIDIDRLLFVCKRA